MDFNIHKQQKDVVIHVTVSKGEINFIQF